MNIKVRSFSALVGVTLVWSAAAVSALSFGEHDHSQHLHGSDLIVAANVPSAHDHSSHDHSSLVTFANFASSVDADEVEWVKLYEKFPQSESELVPAAVRSLADTVSASTVTGDLRVLVVNIATPTRTAAPRGVVVDAYTQAATRVSWMSRGMANVPVDFFSRDVVVPDVANVCTDYKTLSAAADAIVGTEVSLGGYRSVDYVIPYLSTDNCDWAGRATLGGKQSWILSKNNAAPNLGVIVHEWGHQYSLPHLRAIRCTKDGQDLHFVDRAGRAAGQCSTAEYGGAFSIMGPSEANNSSAMTFGERSQLGWLRDGEERREHEGVFTLGYDGPLSLLWLQNSEGDFFQIEFVKAFTSPYSWGFTNPFTKIWHFINQTPNYTHPGVMIKYISDLTPDSGPAGYSAKGYVLDATPETILSTDAAFRAGTTFVDPTGSVNVEVLSVADQSAQVRIRGVPLKPLFVKSVQAVATETRGVFDVSFTPTANPPVTHYEVQVSNNYEFTNPQTYVVTASPGRVTIPNHINFWTIYRVAAVNSVGRGDFTAAKLLEWPKTAKLQNAPVVVATPTTVVNTTPTTVAITTPTKTVACKKKKQVKTFSRAKCPAGWSKAGF